MQNSVLLHLGIGQICRPYQQPFPTVSLSIVSPNSSSATYAAERGWEILSANFIRSQYIQSHWMAYAEGCRKVERQPNSDIWRIARSILATDDPHRAEDYVANSDGGFGFYFRYFMNLYRNQGILRMLKPDLNALDDDLRLNDVIRSMVTFGVVDSVLDQLVALFKWRVPFGTLLMVGHDWDDKALWQRSMTLLAQEVMPRLNQHLEVLQNE